MHRRLCFSRFFSQDLGKNLLYGHETQVLQDLEVAKTHDLTRRSPEPTAGLMLMENTGRETMPTQPTSQESGGKKLCQNMQCPKACKPSLSQQQGPISSGAGLDDDIYYFLSMRFFPLFNLKKRILSKLSIMENERFKVLLTPPGRL